jgi:hypothetical protein
MLAGRPSSKHLLNNDENTPKSGGKDMRSSYSIQLSDNDSEAKQEFFSKEIEKITRNMIGSSITRIPSQKDRYKLKIC